MKKSVRGRKSKIVLCRSVSVLPERKICKMKFNCHDVYFQIRPGRAYLAFTEYNRKSSVGTVAFKDVEDVAFYRAIRGVLGSSHLVHYHMVHGRKPILGDWKIFTGEKAVYDPESQERHSIPPPFAPAKISQENGGN